MFLPFFGSFLLLFLEVIGVITPIQHQLAIPQFHDPIGNPGDEVTVMGDHQHGSFERTDCVLKHLFGRDVQMVGGFIEHQEVAGAQQH